MTYHLTVEEFYGGFQVSNGHKHVLEMAVKFEPESYYFSICNTCLDLDHMLSFIEPLQSFALSKLEQRDLEKREH